MARYKVMLRGRCRYIEAEAVKVTESGALQLGVKDSVDSKEYTTVAAFNTREWDSCRAVKSSTVEAIKALADPEACTHNPQIAAHHFCGKRLVNLDDRTTSYLFCSKDCGHSPPCA